jgi:hypothetical protein
MTAQSINKNLHPNRGFAGSNGHENGKRSQTPHIKTCIAVGFALGIVLLWETISTYNYVAGNLLMAGGTARCRAEARCTSNGRCG